MSSEQVHPYLAPDQDMEIVYVELSVPRQNDEFLEMKKYTRIRTQEKVCGETVETAGASCNDTSMYTCLYTYLITIQ